MQNELRGRDLALAVARLALDKQADEIMVLDLSAIESAPADYFVVCTVSSDVQSEAVATSIRRGARSLGVSSPQPEGDKHAAWILIDFFDVVVHILRPESRQFYKLERLWGDATVLRLTENGELVA